MGQSIDSAIVRIMRGNSPVGAGCLVHGHFILTCAHVVRDALSLPRTATDRPKNPIRVEFAKFPELEDLAAQVVFWYPWDDDGPSPDGLTDIAVLDVGHGLREPVPAHLLKTEDERLGGVNVYGFPEDAPLGPRYGDWLEAEAGLEVIGPSWFPLYRSRQSRSFIRPGFSGGPVVIGDEGPQPGRVAGIVVLRNREHEPEKQAAYAISAEVLRKALDRAKQELDSLSRVPPVAAESPPLVSSANAALGDELGGTLEELRTICSDLKNQHNVPIDLIKGVDRLARASQRAVRADGQPDLQRLSDYNEDWADLAAAVDREEADKFFESSPVRKLIDQIDQLTNHVLPTKGLADRRHVIPWDDPEHPATKAAEALKDECDSVSERLWPEGADVSQEKRDVWHDVDDVYRTVSRRDGFDSRRLDGCRRCLEKHKINLLTRTRTLIGILQGKFADRLRPGTVFRDVEHGPEMVVIPAGGFTMGSPVEEEGYVAMDGPQHQVTLARSFALGRYAMTFDEFDRFCADQSDREPPSDQDWGRGRRPVIHVSTEDAEAYLAWLSQMTGTLYRLPSEAEWEYACRAGTTTPFWTGETISTDQANYDGNHTYGSGEKGEYRKQTVPVGSFDANSFGLYDMHGNVWEWCADPWHENYDGAPTDGSAWLDGGDASQAVVRGGSWYNFPRSTAAPPAATGSLATAGNDDVGFRAARTLG